MLKFENMAAAYIATLGASSLTVPAGHGARFPVAGAGVTYRGKITEPSSGAYEIIHVTSHGAGTDAFSITRAQEGTAQQTFGVTAIFSLEATAEVFDSIMRRRNRLINGCFRLWDYGTSSASPADGVFVANRWRVHYLGTTGTSTFSRVAQTLGEWEADVAPIYLARWNMTVAPSLAPSVIQPVEGVQTLAGQKVVVSFLAKSASGTPNLSMQLTQNFGTGGAPSASVVTTAAAQAISTTLTKYTFAFTLPSIAGKTLGSNGNDYLGVEIIFPTATFDISIGNVQLQPGNVASDFEFRAHSLERDMAARYFWKTFSDDVAPAQNAGIGGAIGYVSALAGVNNHAVHIRFPVPMRATPTVTFYNPSAANALWRNNTAGADSGAASGLFATLGNKSFTAVNAQAAGDGAGHGMLIHASATAEL